MTDTLQALQDIKQAVAEKQRARAKREADVDSLKARIREDVKRLKDDYGVESVDAAREKLAQLDQDLEDELAQVRQLLEEAQA